MQPDINSTASSNAITARNLLRMFLVLNDGAIGGLLPSDDVLPSADVPPGVPAPARVRALPGDSPDSAGHTRHHPIRLAEPTIRAKQTMDEPTLGPPFRLPSNQEPQSQP